MPFPIRMKPQTSRAEQGRADGSFLPAMDRRLEARCRADRRQAVSAQLIGGVDVKLCNVSTRGVMFESSMRVLVGAHVTVRLRTATRTVTLPGTVVRSRVSATHHGRLRFETALKLESDCPLSNDELMLVPDTHTDLISVVDGEVVDAEVMQSVTLVTSDWQ
jgi:hypothetical protein